MSSTARHCHQHHEGRHCCHAFYSSLDLRTHHHWSVSLKYGGAQYVFRQIQFIIMFISIATAATDECSVMQQITDNTRSLENVLSDSCGECQYTFSLIAPFGYFVELVVSDMYGFTRNTSGGNSKSCTPRLEVFGYRESSISNYTVLCKPYHGFSFVSSAENVTISFTWNNCNKTSLLISYAFHYNDRLHYDDKCMFHCAKSNICLNDKSLLCDGQVNCADQTDEQNCLKHRPTDTQHNRHTVLVVCGAIGAIILCLFLILMVRHFFLRSQSNHHERSCSGHSLLSGQPSSLCNSAASSKNDPYLEFCKKIRYPPSIPVSLDGEEGYHRSQVQLRHSLCDPGVHVPPNRTASEADSPPPYRSRSVGQQGKEDCFRKFCTRDPNLASGFGVTCSISEKDELRKCGSLDISTRPFVDKSTALNNCNILSNACDY